MMRAIQTSFLFGSNVYYPLDNTRHPFSKDAKYLPVTVKFVGRFVVVKARW